MTNVDELLDNASAGRYEPFKFDSVGTTIRGAIAEQPVSRPLQNRFNNNVEDTLILAITHEDGKTYSIFAKSPSFLLGAIADAVKKSGGKLVQGGRLAIRFTETRDTGKPQPAKVFSAQYEPPTTSGTATDDLLAGATSNQDLSDVL